MAAAPKEGVEPLRGKKELEKSFESGTYKKKGRRVENEATSKVGGGRATWGKKKDNSGA